MNLLHGQTAAVYSQFNSSKLSLNPAYAGAHLNFSATALYRNQWLGIDGAPVSLNFGIQSSFLKDRCGLGLTVSSDKIGMTQASYISLAYSYQFIIDETSKFSIGLSGALEHQRINWAELDVWSPDDHNFYDAASTSIRPNFGFGVYYYKPNFFLGISTPFILENTFYQSDDDTNFYKIDRTFFLNAGFAFNLNSKLILKTSVLTQIQQTKPFGLEANLSFVLYNSLNLGCTYRLNDAISPIIQYQINEKLKLGMAFDFTLSDLSTITKGGYEMLLHYRFSKRKSLPEFYW